MNPVKRVLYILTLRCDESARLQSQAMDDELLGYERLALRMHLLSCRGCKRYRRYLRVFRSLIGSIIREELGADWDGGGGSTLSPEAKSRMKSLIGRASSG